MRSAYAEFLRGLEPGTPRFLSRGRQQEVTTWLRRTDRLRVLHEPMLGRLAVPMMVAVATAFAWAAFVSLPYAVNWWDPDFESAPWTEIVPFAMVALVLVPPLAAFVLYRSFRGVHVRRNVGKLWDVLTFWPRWFHPFAPPSYSARAIPELRTRIGRLPGRVVLSGHSQGSVLAVATLAQLGEADRRRVGLLTHGSPIGTLYGRYFPDYFSPEQMQKVAAALSNRDGEILWRNLYRPTDYLGGPIFDGSDRIAAAVDVRCLDPYPLAPPEGDPFPRARGHSDYPDDPPYGLALTKLQSELAKSQDGLPRRSGPVTRPRVDEPAGR